MLPTRMVPATAKVIWSAPGAAFASRIAWRSEPAPESSSVLTTKVLLTCKDVGIRAAGETAAVEPASWRRTSSSAPEIRSVIGLAGRPFSQLSPVWITLTTVLRIEVMEVLGACAITPDGSAGAVAVAAGAVDWPACD